jgi:alkylation response protein AidB-like acyl-CoA dehydrogenase
MFEYATEAQLDRYMAKMASGEEIWCQGWSEPDAGSDLAGIRSKAVKVDGGWVLTGQKTWCSRGAFAHRCFGIFRTDPEAARHRGLTYFLIPMNAEGVTVRPIGQLDGETGFAEVFFDEVFVPDEDVLGGIGDGWKVAMATAGSERGISLRSPARYTEAAAKLVDLFLDFADQDDFGMDPRSAIADEVMQAYVDAEAYKLHTYMTATKVREGHKVGAEASATKIFWSETDVAIHRAALKLLGPDAELEVDDGRGGTDLSEWLDGYLFALSGPIYAGTNEIQRNVVAERMLGLPRA